MAIPPILKTIYNAPKFWNDYWNQPDLSLDDLPNDVDLTDKVYIVSRAESDKLIGFHVVSYLVKMHAKVYILGKDFEAMEDTVNYFNKQYPKGPKVGLIFIDFNDLTTIKHALEDFFHKEKRLDGVVHNTLDFVEEDEAEYSAQGIEKHLAVNCIAPHLLQRYLDDLLIKTAKEQHHSRVAIVWVSSLAHLYTPADIDFKTIPADNCYERYGLSKTINLIQSYQWKVHHPHSNVESVAINPGLFTKPEQAAAIELNALLNGRVDLAPTDREDIIDWCENEQGSVAWDWLDTQTTSYL